MKRKTYVLVLIFLLLISLLAGCSSQGGTADSSSNPNQLPSQSGEQIGTSESEDSNMNESNQTKPTDDAPIVYFTSNITPEGLVAVYEKLGWNPTGKVAVKLSTGEPPASNYLRPELIKELVQSIKGTIVECNTAYGGSRAQTAMHYQVAKQILPIFRFSMRTAPCPFQ